MQRKPTFRADLFWSACGATLVGVLFLGKDVAIARQFRTDPVIGQIYLGIAIVSFINASIFGALHQVLIRYASAASTRGGDAAQDGLRALVRLLFLAAPLSAAALFAGLPTSSELLAFPTVILSLILLQICSAVTVICQAILIGSGRMLQGSSLPAITPAFILVWCLLLNFTGPDGLAMSAAAGAAVEAFFSFRALPRTNQRSREGESIERSAAALMPGTFLTAASELVDPVLANGLNSESVSIIQFSRFPLLVASFGYLVIGRALLPGFVRAEEEGIGNLENVYRKSLLRVSLAGLPVALLAPWYGPMIARAMYGTSESMLAMTNQVGALQTMYWLSVPCSLLTVITTRLLMSRDLNRAVSLIFFGSFLIRALIGIGGLRQIGIAAIPAGAIGGSLAMLLFSLIAVWYYSREKLTE